MGLRSLHFPALGNRKRPQRIINPKIYRHILFRQNFCGRFGRNHRFLSHLRCSMILTQLIARAVINFSTSNNRQLIRRLRCRDLDPLIKTKFFGIVVEALVESGTLTVSQRTKSRRGSPNWARRHFDKYFHLIALQPGYFKRLYRLSKETFLMLETLIAPRLARKKSRGPGKADSVYPLVMLAITFRFVAGATCLDLAWPYSISVTTVYYVIDETLDDILQNTKFPSTEGECQAASEGFQWLRNSPFCCVIGAIDGIAVANRASSPSECPKPSSFFNRKGFFAIIVQAVVGADYSVLYLSAKHAGSTNDSTAFQSTALFEFLLLVSGEIGAIPEFAVLSADDAYGNGSCNCRIITPYSGRLTQMEDTFNPFWSSLRIVVEKVFRVSVARWGILWSPLRCSLSKHHDNRGVLQSCIILLSKARCKRRLQACRNNTQKMMSAGRPWSTCRTLSTTTKTPVAMFVA
jgi:hypothetical protein